MRSGLVEPRFAHRPDVGRTYGPEVADLAARMGLAPDPEQEFALDVLFAIDERGAAAVFEACVICGRQNLKTVLLEQAVLGWLFVTDQRLVVWSAHEMRTTKEAFRDLAKLVLDYPPARRRLPQTPNMGISRGNGDEAIELVTGQRVIFRARTSGGGRGLSGDRVVLDEGFALQPEHMGSLLPTLSARPDPQVVIGSSAGKATSEVLRGMRDRGRAGSSPRQAYLEWTSHRDGCRGRECDHMLGTPGCALDDEEAWRQANPALGRRISLETLRSEREAMPPAEFARERLGWWDDPPMQSADPVLDRAAWAAMDDATSGRLSPLAFGVTVSADRSRAEIGVAGWRGDELVQVELAAAARGVRWPLDWLASAVPAWSPGAVVLDGTALPMARPLEEMGVPVVTTSSRDRARATVGFFDEFSAGRLRHPGEPLLDEAVARAGRRPLGDGFVWEGERVGPLVAVTLAVHGLVEHCRPTEPPPSPQPVDRQRKQHASRGSDLATVGF